MKLIYIVIQDKDVDQVAFIGTMRECQSYVKGNNHGENEDTFLILTVREWQAGEF